MNETTTNQEIFSSTGRLGTSERQDGRLYHNAEVFYGDYGDVETAFTDLNQEAASMSHITRTVFRGLVSARAIEEIIASGLRSDLEVALPLAEFGRSEWLVYLARNAAGRESPNTTEAMIEATSSYEPARRHETDARTVETVNSGAEKQLEELWSPTFGWSREEIVSLAGRLKVEAAMDPRERSTWFAGVTAGGQLVSAAMAERITLPGQHGELDLVESTEWRTLPLREYKNRGLMNRTLRWLNGRILGDLAQLQPLIYAECNFTSRSDRAGYHAGFRIPERRYAPQILKQNVTVNEGEEGYPPPGLRDFTFMYLPADWKIELW